MSTLLTDEQIEAIVKSAKEYNDYPFNNFLQLWNKIVAFLKKHVEFQDERTYEVLTAWVFATWIPEVWETYPYLYFYGISESGKNQAWQTLAKISYKPVECANISGAGIFRSVRPEIFEDKVLTAYVQVKGEGYRQVSKTVKVPSGRFNYATLFMDELGILTAQSSENEQMKHQILDSGYKKGGSVIRCVGKNFETKSFPVDGFKSIASVYMVPDALKSRCIMIQMVRSQRRFPLRHDEREVNDIITGLMKWRIIAYLDGTIENTKATAYPLHTSLEFDNTFIEPLLFDECHNGRLVQLFYPLYRVAPLSKKGLILEVLRDEGKQKAQVSASTFEADIFQAVLKVYEKSPRAYVLFTTDISRAYNDEHIDATIKDRTIKRQVEALGFKPYRTAKRNGFRNDKALIEKLKLRFQVPEFDSGTSGISGASGASTKEGIGITEPTLPSYTERPQTAQAPQTAQKPDFIIIDSSKCEGCGTCVDTCPIGLFEIVGTKAVRKKVEGFECLECLACVAQCPTEALKANTNDPTIPKPRPEQDSGIPKPIPVDTLEELLERRKKEKANS
jgi:ferredoxin